MHIYSIRMYRYIYPEFRNHSHIHFEINIPTINGLLLFAMILFAC